MSTFYDDWRGAGERAAEAFRCSPMIAKDREIPWVQTPYDARCKLMISKRQGFPTMGSNVIKAEIPVGWHTGKHAHGPSIVVDPRQYMQSLEGFGFALTGGSAELLCIAALTDEGFGQGEIGTHGVCSRGQLCPLRFF